MNNYIYIYTCIYIYVYMHMWAMFLRKPRASITRAPKCKPPKAHPKSRNLNLAASTLHPRICAQTHKHTEESKAAQNKRLWIVSSKLRKCSTFLLGPASIWGEPYAPHLHPMYPHKTRQTAHSPKRAPCFDLGCIEL